MEYFKADLSVKCDHLRKFGRAYLGDESWSMRGVGEGAERELLEGFGAYLLTYLLAYLLTYRCGA